MERRQFCRIPFPTQAVVKSNGVAVRGQVTDLSLSGLRLEVKKVIPPDSKVEISIQLGGDESEFDLNVSGTVLRQMGKTMAIQFDLEGMDPSALTILQRVLTLCHQDEGVVQREYKEFLTRLSRKRKKERKLQRRRAREQAEQKTQLRTTPPPLKGRAKKS